MSEQQTLPSRFKDPRLSGLPWKEQEGKYGPYNALNVENLEDGGQWLLDHFKNADEKGFIYDLEGVYRYKRNGNWINRYKKTRADGEFEQAIARGFSIVPPGTTATASTTSTTSFNEGAKKGHEENVKMHEEDKEMHETKMLVYRELIDEIRMLRQELKANRGARTEE